LQAILHIDHVVADEWGRMSAKRPLSTTDALLAATAKVHGMTFATRNIVDVTDLDTAILNPFEPRT
jgi:predicted nucleic acid-binding protein